MHVADEMRDPAQRHRALGVVAFADQGASLVREAAQDILLVRRRRLDRRGLTFGPHSGGDCGQDRSQRGAGDCGRPVLLLAVWRSPTKVCAHE